MWAAVLKDTAAGNIRVHVWVRIQLRVLSLSTTGITVVLENVLPLQSLGLVDLREVLGLERSLQVFEKTARRRGELLALERKVQAFITLIFQHCCGIFSVAQASLEIGILLPQLPD